ncbi:MAG: ABC transporter permease, partial [Deltaproteobacteria bacterium]
MKRILMNLKIAVRSLLSFKVRSALAILGVFLGTFSLIVVSNLSGSLAKKTQMEIDKLGKDMLIVRSGVVFRFGRGTRFVGQQANLSYGDVRAIQQGVSQVKAVSPSNSSTLPVRYGGTVLDGVLITGSTPNFTQVRDLTLQEGTFFTERDNKTQSATAVLGDTVAKKLFGEKSPLGKYILVQRFACQVIGVIEKQGSDLSEIDQDSQVYLPLNTYLRRVVNQTYMNTIFVQCENRQALDQAKFEIENILRRRHHIQPGDRDDFTVIDLKDVNELQNQAMDTITTLGRVSALISFLIGGLGILSIMTLIVSERKMEIGIRRAVGSRKRDVGETDTVGDLPRVAHLLARLAPEPDSEHHLEIEFLAPDHLEHV